MNTQIGAPACAAGKMSIFSSGAGPNATSSEPGSAARAARLHSAHAAKC